MQESKKTKHRCSKCNKEIKHGVLEDNKLYCHKCYFWEHNTITQPVSCSHDTDSDKQMIVVI